MRLFIAIPIAKQVRQQLADLQQPVEGIRWQKKEQMHLTLKFLGDTPGEQFRKLLPQLESVETDAFSITLQGFGYFPRGKHPRVLWAGVEPSEPLLELQKEIEQACSEVGFEPEQRSFTPHITLGRIKGGSKSDVMSFINQHKQFKVTDVPVTKYVLYESKLQSEGASHHRRKVFQLREQQ